MQRMSDCIRKRKPKYHSKIYDRLEELEKRLHKWVATADKTTVELKKISAELDKYFGIVQNASKGGTKATIAAAITAFVGIGLSPFSFGASLLSAGGCLAAGGVTIKGLQFVYNGLRKRRSESAENLLEKYKTMIDNIITEVIQIGNLFDGFWDIDECFPNWVHFWGKVFVRSVSVYGESDWSKIVTCAEDKKRKSPIKLSSISEVESDHSLVAERIRSKVNEILMECPTDIEIETVIRITLSKLHERLA